MLLTKWWSQHIERKKSKLRQKNQGSPRPKYEQPRRSWFYDGRFWFKSRN